MAMRHAAALAFCVLGGAALAPGAEALTSRPNVVLFLVDDMGWMDSTPYGSQFYETPHMQRLAGESMRFTDAYSQPLCSPTRASLLTGQYSARHGITSASGHQPPQPAGHSFLPDTASAKSPLRYPESKNYLEPSQFTLAEALHDAGYRTAHIGKWHLGLTPEFWPERQGFDVAFHCHPDPGPPGNYFSPYGVVQDGAPSNKARVGTITDGPAGEYIVDRLTDEAVRFIEDNRERPFFLNLWQYGVHGPWGHKAAYTAEFAQKQDPTGRQGNPIMASMLRSVDESLGRVLETLDRLGLAENTIVIFTSDNGGNTHSNTPGDPKSARRDDESGPLADWRKWAGDRPPTNNAPLRDGKGRLYEGGVRVPLMVRWPGHIAPGSTSDAVVGCIDVYPTVLDLTGVARNPQQTIDGVSYAPVLRGTGKLEREAYFIWFPHLVPGVSVRQGDWKLIRRFEPRPADFDGLNELFNLREDLGETKNLAAEQPDKVRELNALIDAWLPTTGAVTPQPNPAWMPSPVDAKPGPNAAADGLSGLVARGCELSVANGALRVQPSGGVPFIGIAQVRNSGPLTLKLSARSASGGAARVHWKTADQAMFPENQATAFTWPAGTEWQTVEISLPVQGTSGTIRLYLPAGGSAVEIGALEFVNATTQRPVRTWDFRPISR
jgi:arylsulfatase A-like enzyme